VEAQVAAPSAAFERLLARLRRGPASARVDRLEIEPVDEEPGFEGFTVRD
jgi:acylphosphatase